MNTNEQLVAAQNRASVIRLADLPFEPADLDALDAENHARDLDIEHFDLSWRDRD